MVFWWINPEQYANPLIHLLSGGAIIGAFYMATDPGDQPGDQKGDGHLCAGDRGYYRGDPPVRVLSRGHLLCDTDHERPCTPDQHLLQTEEVRGQDQIQNHVSMRKKESTLVNMVVVLFVITLVAGLTLGLRERPHPWPQKPEARLAQKSECPPRCIPHRLTTTRWPGSCG